VRVEETTESSTGAQEGQRERGGIERKGGSRVAPGSWDIDYEMGDIL